MAKLKPCPKCGANNKRTIPVQRYFDVGYKVRCLNCKFETDSFDSKREAHKTWNDLKKEVSSCSL